MINLIKKTVGIAGMFTGLIMVMGSANDCDGKCMENANSIEVMLLISLIGFVFMISGYFIWKSGENNG